MRDDKFFSQDKERKLVHLFGEKRKMTHKQKLGWLATGFAVVMLLAVFTFTNQDLWNRQIPETGDTQQPINSLPSVQPEGEPSILVGETQPNVPAPQQAAPAPPADTDANSGEAEAETLTAAAAPTDWLAPAAGAFSRQYGYDLDPTFEDYRFHGGVDLDLPVGELVLAVADGEVKVAQSDERWGGRVEIAHGGGYTSIYLGITPSGLKVGQQVTAGDTVGTVAPSPKAEAKQPTHLHLEILQDGQRVDPATLLH